uniref:Uncharacterized protein n=1 Tax=Utricularia reniformis TaxID=192314 RepID=A0A1Y0B0B2_9LAMI|nr:hypothetical protein AEK19_MT0562 [Utricularia reniformis]ART30818.1 hypothetical protein AEK19_MT0562 [Utricularia reniformis]
MLSTRRFVNEIILMSKARIHVDTRKEERESIDLDGRGETIENEKARGSYFKHDYDPR